MMTMDQQFPRAASAKTEHAPLVSIWSGLAAWLRACGKAYAVAAIYEDLSRLSDAELKRRGLSRENLARDVLKSYERGN